MFRLLQSFSRESKAALADPADSLDVFASEEASQVRSAASRIHTAFSRWYLRLSVAGAIVISVAMGGYLVQKSRPLEIQAASASLTIESDPAGAEVFAAGVRRGTTPLTIPIAPGEHTFELVSDGRRKPLRTTAQPGAAVVHHVQFEAPPPPVVAAKAVLEIVTDPARLPVHVDGKSVGFAPVILRELEPGPHKVRVDQAGASIERSVEVKTGESASLIIQVPLPAPARAVETPRSAAPAPVSPAAGWVTITSPILVQIFRGSEIVGTSRSPKILLPAGRHELQLLNEELGVTATIIVDVVGGKSTTVVTDVPSVPLSINAVPWANVWVGGKRLGETPIGNHHVPVGTHEVVFRHPELGERRQSVTVTTRSPARVSVDMRKPQ